MSTATEGRLTGSEQVAAITFDKYVTIKQEIPGPSVSSVSRLRMAPEEADAMLMVPLYQRLQCSTILQCQLTHVWQSLLLEGLLYHIPANTFECPHQARQNSRQL